MGGAGGVRKKRPLVSFCLVCRESFLLAYKFAFEQPWLKRTGVREAKNRIPFGCLRNILLHTLLKAACNERFSCGVPRQFSFQNRSNECGVSFSLILTLHR